MRARLLLALLLGGPAAVHAQTLSPAADVYPLVSEVFVLEGPAGESASPSVTLRQRERADCSPAQQLNQEAVTSVATSEAGDQEIGGQSFTAPCTGQLDSLFYVVQFTAAEAGQSNQGRLRVYQGAGTGGAVLSEESFSFTAPTDTTRAFFLDFDLETPVDVVQDSVYTFFLDQEVGSLGIQFNNSGADAYPGGALYLTPDGDPTNAGTTSEPLDLLFYLTFLPPRLVANEADLESGVRLSLSPNPSAHGSRLTLRVGAAQTVRVTVHDALGREVSRALPAAVPGGADVSVDVPTGGLAPGVYVVHVAGETFASSRSLTVVR